MVEQHLPRDGGGGREEMLPIRGTRWSRLLIKTAWHYRHRPGVGAGQLVARRRAHTSA